jgi:hypothetical protein
MAWMHSGSFGPVVNHEMDRLSNDLPADVPDKSASLLALLPFR